MYYKEQKKLIMIQSLIWKVFVKIKIYLFTSEKPSLTVKSSIINDSIDEKFGD